MLRHLKNVFTRKLPTKFISLALAVLIWYYVGGEITDRAELSLPFQVSLQPAGDWIVLDQRDWTVNMVVRGSRSEIQRIRALAWSIRGSGKINVADLKAHPEDIVDDHQIFVEADKFNFPFTGVEIVSIEPREINVKLGRVGFQRLKVAPQIEGKPAEGFERAADFVRPTHVRVRGPLVFLKDVTEIMTKPVSLDERTDSFDDVVKVRNRIGDTDFELDETDVRVWVEIREINAELPVPRVPVKIVLPHDFPQEEFLVKLREEFVDVTLRGPKLLLQNLDSSRISITARIAPPTPDDYEKPSTDHSAQLEAAMVGFENKKDEARIFPELTRTESTYILTRREKK